MSMFEDITNLVRTLFVNARYGAQEKYNELLIFL